MFTPEQYRAKAREYAEWAKATISPKNYEFKMLEQSFTTLADNEQWLAENHSKTVHAKTDDIPAGAIDLAAQEEHVLRCLGAALIMQWSNTPPGKPREAFWSPPSWGRCWTRVTLRGQIARFLRTATRIAATRSRPHKNNLGVRRTRRRCCSVSERGSASTFCNEARDAGNEERGCDDGRKPLRPTRQHRSTRPSTPERLHDRRSGTMYDTKTFMQSKQRSRR